MNKTNVSRIISGKPDRGLNKYMLEEVFFSESCLNTDDENDEKYAYKKGVYNPQNARFENGKYYFNFPDFWYNHLSNNKAIALRKIDLRAETLNIILYVRIRRTPSGGITSNEKIFPIGVVVQPNMSTFAVLRTIANEVNKEICQNGAKKFLKNPEKTVFIKPIYNYETSTATFELYRGYDNSEGETHYFSFEIFNLNNDAEYFFKTKNEKLPPFTECTNAKDGTMKYEFNNVWNREFLFVHASFVNGTSFNYLGRSGEFYTKPSKMYRFGGSSQQFYFELSYDGRTPIKDRMGVFTIDLAFIYHDKDYQAE